MKLSHRVRKNTVARHLEALRLLRARAIRRTIPRDSNGRQRAHSERAIAVAVGQLGRRWLARVVWPWQARPVDAGQGTPHQGRARRQALAIRRRAGARIPRGRPSNPTALA